MTNKVYNYIQKTQQLIHDKGALLSMEERQLLGDIQVFFANLNDLIGGTVVEQAAVQSMIPQPSQPAPQVLSDAVQIADPIVPVPTGAPAAVKLSSLMQPEVTGCIAAQPQSIKQAAAQEELDKLLAEKKTQDELEAQLRQQMEEKQVSLEESLRQQLEQQKAQAPQSLQAVEVSVAPKGQMTLEEFEAMHAKKEQDDKQALFDSMLAQVKTAEVRTPEVQ